MKAYYEEAGITIYHGDCREILPALPKVDLVLTDPPYGIGIAANPVRQKFAKQDWDAIVPSAETVNAVLASGTTAIIWGGNYFDLPPSKCFLVWDKCQPEEFSLAMCEQAWTNINKPAKLFQLRVTSYVKEHPTEKPVPLMTWCIKQVPLAPATVLDPFMGSGTTLVACKQAGLQCTGIEREERYCEIAANRLRQGVLWGAQ